MAKQSFTLLFQSGPVESHDVFELRLELLLGSVSRAQALVHTRSYVDPDELLGQAARVVFGRDKPERTFDGIITSVEMSATAQDNDERGHVYRIDVSSVLGLLEAEVDCRIFQDKDVREIVSEILTGFGVEAKRQSWHLSKTYGKREYCVWYNESALAFISRLLEEEGIYFWADSGDRGEVLVFDDDSTASEPIDGKSIPFRHGAGLERSEEAIEVMAQRYRLRAGKVTLRDYDFQKPSFDLTVNAEAESDTDLEIYDYPGLYATPEEGAHRASIRLEALRAECATVDIIGGCPGLVAGKWLEIVDAPETFESEYFITSAIHEIKQGTYAVRATLIPKRVHYRSPQRTPRPIINGPQTAAIVAPEGSPAEEIHTDEHGRCKVRFHWDRYGKNDDSATCWMRVAQLQTSGSMILPRVGWEVIVEFVEGNPDRPIITGRMYNGKYMPPYALPEGKSRTAWQTRVSPGGAGANEIRFEDKSGSEEISIRSHKNTTIATANNKKKSVGTDEVKHVKVNTELSVGANQTIQVTNGYLNTVDGSQKVDVGGSRTVEVNAVCGLTSGGASSTSVGGNQMEMDGNPIQALLSLAAKAATEAAQAAAAKELQKLDSFVSEKVQQVMGPIDRLQGQVQAVSNGLEAVSNGDLGAAAGALGAAAQLPMPGPFGQALANAAALAPTEMNAAPRGDGRGLKSGGAETQGESDPMAGSGAGIGHDGDGFTHAVGLDALVHGALKSAKDKLGDALGSGGSGGGGESAANRAGPEGGASSNSASDSTTGPGYSVNVCSASHSEDVGSLKATIAASGIHTTISGARTQNIGAAHVELVGGTRAETCLAGKTETAVGLVVLSGGTEAESVTGDRTTMVGGAIMDKASGSITVSAGATLTLAGAFHQIKASGAIVFECGGSSVVIDGGGVTIKATAVTVTAPSVKAKRSVTQGL